jgi:hypothetical protein
LVTGSIGASGFIPTANGRLFDRYVNAIRAVETGFPAAILRTFRTSEFLSPLESWSQIDVSTSALQHGKYAEFLSSRFGHATGLSLKRTGSVFGQVTNEAGELLGYGLQIEAGSQKGTAIADYFARVSGVQLTEFQSLNDALLRSQYRIANPGIPYAEWLESLEPQLRRQRLILGSRIRSKINILGKDLQLSKSFAAGLAKTETVFNLLRAKAASTTGRLNTLLSAPLDIPYLGGVLSKIPGLRSLSVRPGTSTQMISRFIGKGLLIGAGWKGLEYLDYLRHEGSPLAPVFSTAAGAGIGSLIARAPGAKFSKAGLLIGGAVGLLAGIAPRFDEGLFYGAATLATDLTLTKAEISESIGLTESLQEQERVTPGLTDISTGMAFAGIGAMAAGFFSYGGLLKESILNRKSASRFADVIELTRAARKENLLKGVWKSRFGRAIEDIPLLKNITKTKSPMLLGALAGFAGWQLLSSGLSILSGNPMAAVPGASVLGTTETPEALQAIYSGEEEVPIRKGRFWEFGRCLAEHTEIITFSGISKKAKDIKIGDVLVGRDYKKATVKNIFTRHHKGEILKFSCAFDRDLKVEVTGNHRIPILRKSYSNKEHRVEYKTKEVKASEIRLNDYVEVPVKKLESNITDSATNPAVINYKGKIYAAIRTIETEEYDGVVYDFEVDNPDHLFRAGPFLVHNSSFEGDKIQYFRQHALPRLRARAYQKGLYGSEEERWGYSPWLNPVKALFGSDEWKYHYEQKYQKERPAPVTAPAGQEIPFIGPLVAETIGKLIKPRKLVRPEEWITDTGVKYKPSDEELEPAYGVGGLSAGQPLSPGEPTQLFNELLYRRREAIGLVGFTEGALVKSLLGREEIFPNQQTLAQMGKETGGENWLFQHLNLGGAYTASEPTRRFIPRTRSYLDTYNPLSNQMPSWMPGEDYFMDFKTGNPYQLSQLPEAEIRLPGPGLASLYPALEGVDPENYPLAYRAKVLGDVAFWSNEYRQTISQAKKNLKYMSEEEQQIVLTTEEQVKAKKQRRNFKDYVFAQDQLQQETVTVTNVLSPRRFKTKEYGDTILEAKGIGAITKPQEALETTRNVLEGSRISIYSPGLESRRFSRVSEGPRMEVVPMLGDRDLGTVLTEAGYAQHKELEDEFRQIRFTPSERLAGSISEKVLHGAETPLEYLTPISPASKLIRQRSPIEEYERTEAIGTANSFWDRPVDNFLKPAYNMTKYELGSSEIPEEIQQRRDITEYFDKLQWVKASRLEAKAKLTGDFHLASEFKKQKESTVFGVNVFGSPVNVMRALPRRERDFFNEFVQAKTIEDREKILSLVPEDERRIYISQWARQEENSSRAKLEAKIATEDDNKTLGLVAQMRKSEGFSFDEAMARRWMEETGGKIPFDDWLREQKAEEYFRTHSLPGADWIGFNPAVSLDDIRMVAVEMLGQDFHEHDLWDDRKRMLARKPYINPTVVSEMQEQAEYQDSWKVARNSKALTQMFGDYKASLYQSKIAANIGPPRYNIELRDGRQDLVDKAYERITG